MTFIKHAQVFVFIVDELHLDTNHMQQFKARNMLI